MHMTTCMFIDFNKLKKFSIITQKSRQIVMKAKIRCYVIIHNSDIIIRYVHMLSYLYAVNRCSPPATAVLFSVTVYHSSNTELLMMYKIVKWLTSD